MTVAGPSDRDRPPASRDPEAAEPVVAGVVLYRPEPAILARLLAALAARHRRVLVFVNGPADSEIETLLEGQPDIRILRAETNLGLAAGLNAVARAAVAEGRPHLVVFDQDSEPPADLPERLRDHWAALRSCGVSPAAIGPQLPAPAGESFRSIRHDFRRADDPPGLPALAAVEYLPTSGSLVALDAFAAVGPFRDDFFIDGIDVEWGLRAWAVGHPCYIAIDVAMPHRWGEQVAPGTAATPQIGRQPPLRTYYYVRNAVAVMKLGHTPHRWRFRTAARLAAQAAYLVWQGGRGANLAAFVRGVTDGATGQMGAAPPDVTRRLAEAPRS